MAAALLLPLVLGLDVWPFGAARGAAWNVAIAERVVASREDHTDGRVIFVGGSSVLFAVDPDRLGERLGRPVVVLGLNAGVGFDVIAALFGRMEITPRDVVVVMPEINHFQLRQPVDPLLRGDVVWLAGLPMRDDASLRQPGRLWVASRGRAQRVLDAVDTTIVDASRSMAGVPMPSPRSPYDLAAIDGRGVLRFSRPGVVGWLTVQRPDTMREQFDFEASRGVAGLRMIAARARNVGARIVCAPAVRCDHASFTAEQRAAWVEREADILGVAAGFGFEAPVAAGAVFLPAVAAYDTTYHLNDAGVAQLEAVLLPVLSGLMPR